MARHLTVDGVLLARRLLLGVAALLLAGALAAVAKPHASPGWTAGLVHAFDLDGEFAGRCNLERVELETLDPDDVAIVQRLVRRHFQYTRSRRADEVLRKWDDFAPRFVKVFPKDLKLALDARLRAHSGDG